MSFSMCQYDKRARSGSGPERSDGSLYLLPNISANRRSNPYISLCVLRVLCGFHSASAIIGLVQPIPFDPEHAGEILAALPAASAAFTLRGEAGSEPYIAKTADLRRRLTRMLGAPVAGR